MVKRYKRPKQRNKKLLVAIAAVIILVLAGTWLYVRSQNKPAGLQKTSTGHDVNLDPPTEEEKREAEEHKGALSQAPQKDPETTAPQNPNPSTPPTGTLKPFITFAGQEGQNVEVAGYVTGVFEDSGTCTATYTKGSLTVTGESTGFKDADHTTCTPITLARSTFSQTGTWSVTLVYKSLKGSGISEARSVTIQ